MPVSVMDPNAPVPAPLELYKNRVLPEWLDYNNHFNMGYYLVAFDQATDELFEYLDIGERYKDSGVGTTFTLEAHITYTAEMHPDDPFRVTTQLLGYDVKRIHYVHQMFHEIEGFLASTNELVTLNVGWESRRAEPMPEPVLARLARIMEAHADLPRPTGMSQVMGLKSRKRT